MRLASCLLLLLAPALVWADPQPAPKPVPRDSECAPLPAIDHIRLPKGEVLDYDIDILAANAARMEVEVLPKANGLQPVRVRIKTTTFFNKSRRVKAEAKTYLLPKTLRPVHYTEDAYENDLHRVADVDFASKDLPPQSVAIRYGTNLKPGQPMQQVYGRYTNDALDQLAAVYYLRSLDLKPGMSLCFDVYAIRKMWRIWGKVEGIEKVSTPAGEFQALHLAGTAARLDNHDIQRDLHFWFTADDKRIPLGAVGGIDLGPVRATLTHVGHPGSSGPESHAEGLSW